MDRADDRHVIFPGLLLQKFDYSKGGGAIEAARWLVAEEQVGIGD